MPTLLPHPSLFAHTIYQTLVFDGKLKEDGFSLAGTSALSGIDDDNEQDREGQREGKAGEWKGLSEVILGKVEWFEAWLSGESKCGYALAYFSPRYPSALLKMDTLQTLRSCIIAHFYFDSRRWYL